MRKRVICALLASVLILGLTACAKEENKADESPEKTEGSTDEVVTTDGSAEEKEEDEIKSGSWDNTRFYVDEPAEMRCVNVSNKERLENPVDELDTPEVLEPTEGNYTFSGLNMRKVVEYADSKLEDGMDPITNQEEIIAECLKKEYGEIVLERREEHLGYQYYSVVEGVIEEGVFLDFWIDERGMREIYDEESKSVEVWHAGNKVRAYYKEAPGSTVDVILPTEEELKKVYEELEKDAYERTKPD